MTNVLTVSAATLLALMTACSDQGAVKPETTAPAAAAKPPLISSRGQATPAAPTSADGALTWTLPPGWIEEAPSSSMRRAQYKVPGPGGDGECAVFYFGPGQGGDVKSNAERWADQFTLADGGPARSTMTTSDLPVNGTTVVIVEVAGTYNGGMTMTAAPMTPKPGYRLLGGVAPGPDANWFFKFTGPDKTVTAQREAFLGMMRSLKTDAS